MDYSALESFLPIFSAIPESLVKSPHVFVGTFLHTARQLIPVVKEDWPELVGAGLRQDLLYNYEKVVEALAIAESVLNKTRFSSEEIHQQWEFKAPQVYDYLEEFEAAYRLAFRNHPKIKQQVDTFVRTRRSKGGVNELLGLIQLGEVNVESLLAIGFDTKKLAMATSVSYELLAIYRTSINSDPKSQAALEMRNRAFTYVDILVNDIRSAARYLFWNKPQAYSRYTLVYHGSEKSAKEMGQQNVELAMPTAETVKVQNPGLEAVLHRKDRGPAVTKPLPLKPSEPLRGNRFREADKTGEIEQSKF